jgi:hypothetical protein
MGEAGSADVGVAIEGGDDEDRKGVVKTRSESEFRNSRGWNSIRSSQDRHHHSTSLSSS